MTSKTTFYYKAWIARKDRKVLREGTIQANFPLDALDAIAEKATETWLRPLLKVELYEVGEGGELVATSTVKERVDTILGVNEQLRPDKFKTVRERRNSERPLSLPNPQKPLRSMVNLTADHPDKHTWTQKHATFFTRETFPRLVMEEGKKGAMTAKT